MTEPPLAPRFLGKHSVLDIHDAQLAEHGGKPGMLDEGLFESAPAQPMTQFGGHFLHDDLFAMAAAYVFHPANNHAFVDGNKRVALGAALVFLDVNGYVIADEGTELAGVVLEMVEQKRDQAWVAAEFRRRAQPK